MSADGVFFWANWALIAALVLGVLSTYAIVVSGNIKDAEVKRKLSEHEAQTASARAEAAKLNHETELLKADNLSLQRVMLPRHIGIIGIDGPPKAQEYFAGIARFAGTEALIQAAADPEAQNLANEIAIALLRLGGWKPQLIDEGRSQKPAPGIPEGIRVSYPTGKPWTAQEPSQPWFAWHDAAEALANALTNAGLGVGDAPVSRFGFSNEPSNPGNMLAYFDPPLTGVYVEVGPRPISLTIQWMNSRRKAAAGAAPQTKP
jgi:hypothetical protein